jgi:type VI secretion system protein ImpC
MTGAQAEAAINALGALNPQALHLAEAVSLAVHIDKRLLRRARLALTHAGPEAEADLHFSALVRDAGPSGLVFHHAAAALLRRRLQAQPEQMALAWQIVTERHPQLAPTLRTEEQLQWHTLNGEMDAVRQLLRACIGTMVDQGRPGFAAWAIDAVARMDPAARALEEYRMLGLGAAMRTGAGQRQVADLADDRLADWLAWLAPPAENRAKVGVAMVEGGIEFGPASDPRYHHRIELPRRFPQLLDLRDADSGRVQAVALREQAVAFVPTDADTIIITAEDGSRRRLSRKTVSRFARQDQASRVELAYEVELGGAKKRITLPFALGVMADLSGFNRRARLPLDQRGFVAFTADTFEARMVEIAPRVRLQVADRVGGGKALDLTLTFQSIEDFHPDALVRAVPQLAGLLRLRGQIRDLMAWTDGNPALEAALKELVEDPGRLLIMAGPELSVPGLVGSPAWATVRQKLASGGFVEAMPHFGDLDRKIAIESLATGADDQSQQALRRRLHSILMLAGWGQSDRAIGLITALLTDLDRARPQAALQSFLLRQLALLAGGLGPDKAGRHLADVHAATLRNSGPDHRNSAWTATLLGEHLLDRRRFKEAETNFEAALRINRKQPGHDPRLDLRLAIGLAELHIGAGRLQEAEAWLDEAIAGAERLHGTDSQLTAALRVFKLKPKPMWKTGSETDQWRNLVARRQFRDVKSRHSTEDQVRNFRARLKPAMPSARPERLDRIARTTSDVCSLLVDFPDLLSTDLFVTLEDACALIDRVLSDQIGLILRNPDFRRLERSWRGLHYLASHLPPGPDVSLRVLDIARDELDEICNLRSEAGTLLAPAPLYRLMYENAFGQLGGEPCGAIICDFAFSHRMADLELLAALGQVGQMAQVPFITAASPSLLGKGNWADLSYGDRVEQQLSGAEHRGWQLLRNRLESRYLVLTMPGMVARPLYGLTGTEDHAATSFAFDEGDVPPLTMNAGWGLGLRLAEAFRNHGWFARICGVETGGTLEGLATAPFGIERERRATEAAIGDRMEADLVRAGLMPLLARRGTDAASFISAPFLYQPDGLDQTSAFPGQSLPHVMVLSRFAQYVMCLFRDRMGQAMTVREMAQDIDAWLNLYVAADIAPDDAEAQARYPLKAARFEASYEAARDAPAPGTFHFVLSLVPRFQFPGPDVTLETIIIPPVGDGA